MNLNEDFIIKWNVKFPADRWWRKKYNIPLFSESHLQQSQIYISLEYIEDQFFKDVYEKIEEEKVREERYKKGEWIQPAISVIEEDELFDDIDLTKF